jgi:PTS system nitrogen regulatory IIA component
MNLTVREAATMLNVQEEAVYRWIREKDIPFHRVGDHFRFNKEEVLEWATARGLRVSSAEFHHTEASATPSLADALVAGGVHHDVKGVDRESVLEAIVGLMPIEEADQHLLFDFLVAREALGSTGVGDGIAIPHVRNPVVLHVPHASITLCFLEKPVDFDAIDGKPVTTVFLLVSPTVRAHLYLLSRLSAALHNPAFKDAILRRASADEILEEARSVEGALSQRAPPVTETAKDAAKETRKNPAKDVPK